MNRKVVINLLIVVFLVVAVVFGIFAIRQATNYLSRAQEGIGEPKNIIARVVSSDQAILSWTTQQEVISLVIYGTSPTALNQTQSELASVKTHRVTLSNLKPGINYFYQIQVGQEVYTNEGQPWQFTTLDVDAPPKLTESEFRQAYGTDDLRFDYNGDGIVNGFDYPLYLQQK